MAFWHLYMVSITLEQDMLIEETIQFQGFIKRQFGGGAFCSLLSLG